MFSPRAILLTVVFHFTLPSLFGGSDPDPASTACRTVAALPALPVAVPEIGPERGAAAMAADSSPRPVFPRKALAPEGPWASEEAVLP